MTRPRTYCLTRFLAALAVATVANAAIAAPETDAETGAGLPFEVGERVEFRLRWGFIMAGKAVLEVHEPTEIGGVPAHHFSTSIRTTGLADKVYRVRTRIDSYVTLDGRRTLHYRKDQHEGKRRADVSVDFDWDQRTATYRDKRKDKTKEPIDLPETATDMIGALFRFRRMDLSEGEEKTLPVTDGTKIVNGKASLLDTEEVKVPAGRFRALKVAPRTSDLSGVFEQSKDSKLHLWFTDDDRHMLVRLSSAVIVGNFVAEAVDIRPRE